MRGIGFYIVLYLVLAGVCVLEGLSCLSVSKGGVGLTKNNSSTNGPK